MLKRSLALCACIALFLSLCTGCTPAATASGSHKLSIVTTLFPPYDFARQIAGEDAEITKLLPAGVESHMYEPTPADIVAIHRADVFIYTGEAMEPWAARILEGIDNPDLIVVDASKGIDLAKTEHIAHEDEDHDDTDTAQEAYDPHIWTDPVRAQAMAANIVEGLCQADTAHAADYRARGDAYKAELAALDREFETIVAQGQRQEILFGGRFAFYYFTQRYGLAYMAAYDSCSTETEPSAKRIADLIHTIEERRIPVIYYEELVEPKVANSLAQQTGATPLLLHSCHNVSEDELKQGVTYLSLMRQNAENLKKGLR